MFSSGCVTCGGNVSGEGVFIRGAGLAGLSNKGIISCSGWLS